VAVARCPLAQHPEEQIVAECQPNRVQGERAALVEPIVEHQVGAGVSDGKVFVLRLDPWPVLQRELVCGRTTRVLGPKPFRVAGKTLVQPDVFPAAGRQAVAEPGVRELVRDGRRNADIAKKLGRSPNTVRNQVSQLFQIFDVKNRTELASVVSKPVVPITRLKSAPRSSGRS